MTPRADRTQYHFADRLAAGRTTMTDPRARVYRGEGMAGWILNATLAGVGEVRGGDANVRLVETGEVLLFAPTAVHDYGLAPGATRWIHLWVYAYPREHWMPWLRWEPVAPGILTLRPDPATWHLVVERFEELVATVQARGACFEDLAMAILEQILIHCHRVAGGGRIDPRIAHAQEWLAAHHARPVALSEVATACGMSPSRFSHRFREEVGVAPMRWLERLRIDRAREQLVMTARPVHEIAGAVGFGDPDWFGRVFKRETGWTPRAFRQRS